MKMNSSQQLKIGALLSYLAIGINILSALIYSPWMLSKIGSGDYGLYTLATSLINMFMLDFGISSAVSRFASKYVAEGRQDKVNQLLGIVYKLFFGISAIISVALIIVFFFIDDIYLALTPEELERFKIVYIISALYSVISLPFATTVNGVLTSYEKFIQIKLSDVAHKIINVLCIVIALIFGYGLYALVAITAVVNLVTLFFKFFLIKIQTPVKVNIRYWDKGLLKEIFGFSVWVLINTICSRLIMNICPNILGITAGTTAITIFSFASTIEGYSYTFSSAIDGMFMPKIAKIAYKDNDTSKLLPLMIRVGRFQYNTVGLILVGFICVGKEFITLWIGKEYISVYYCAILLLLPAPFYLSQQIGKNAMVMLNKVKYLTYVNIIKALINVTFAVILSVFWGAIGACASICICYLFRNLANLYLYKNKIGIDIFEFSKKCYGKMSIPMIITLLIGALFTRFFPSTGWFYFIFKVILIITLYIALMWLIGYNNEEKYFVKSNIMKIFNKLRIGK